MAPKYITLVNFIMIIKDEFKKRPFRSFNDQAIFNCLEMFSISNIRLSLNDFFFALMRSFKGKEFINCVFSHNVTKIQTTKTVDSPGILLS